jgi:small conductance mechanosensitive channel
MKVLNHRSAGALASLTAALVLAGGGITALSSTGHAQESADTNQLQAQVEQLTAEVQAIWDEVQELFQRYTEAEGEERLIIDAQIDRRTARFRPSLAELIENIVALEQAGGSAPESRTLATEWLSRARQLVRDELQAVQDELGQLRVERAGLPRDQMLPLERQIAQVGTEVDALLLALFRVGSYRAALGLDPAPDWAYLDPLLTERAERLVGEIEFSQGETEALSDRLERAVGEEEQTVLAELTAIQERLRAGTSGLAAVVAVLDQRGIEAVAYKQLIIQATGQVTTDVFNVDVAAGLLKQGWESMVAWGLSHAPQLVLNLVLFTLILVVFWVLSRMVARIVSAAITRTNPDMPKLLKTVGVSIVANAVFLVGILIGLSQLGIHVGPVLAGLGVVGFIVGFALQDSLSNFASGMMILVYQPFDVGDVVEAGGVGGKVAAMSLVSTTILTFDNQKLIVPNREIWGNVIRNKTAEKTRRVDLTVSVGERAEVPRAVEVLQRILDEHPKVLADPGESPDR